MKDPDYLALEQRVASLELLVQALRAAQTATASSGPIAGATATDAELDHPQYGDPQVKKDPKRWAGASQVGRRFSECPPDFLDVLASFKDWCAEKEEADPAKKQYARFSRYDARRARGWAARIRSGWKPPPPAPSTYQGSSYGGEDDEIPF